MIADLVWIFASACLINNFTLTYFLGLCPFFGVTGRLTTAIRLGIANTFVMLMTATATWDIHAAERETGTSNWGRDRDVTL